VCGPDLFGMSLSASGIVHEVRRRPHDGTSRGQLSVADELFSGEAEEGRY